MSIQPTLRHLIVCVLALAGGTLVGCANTPGGAPKDTLARITQAQSITLGYREDAVPFAFKGRDGAPAGYSVELCKRVVASLQSQLKLTKLDIKWVPVTVATRLSAVADGSIDLECGSTSRTLGREQQVDFSLATFVDGASFVSPAAKPVRKVADLNGRRIGVIAGTTTEASLKALAAKGITPQFVLVTTHTDGVAAVRDGRAEAYATDRLILIGEVLAGPAGATLTLADELISVENYGLVMRRDADFRLAVNRGLAGVYRSGEIRRVFAQAFGSGSEPSSMLVAMYTMNALPE